VPAKTTVPATGAAMLSRRWHAQKSGAEKGNDNEGEGPQRPNQEGFHSTNSLPPKRNLTPFYAGGTDACEQLRHRLPRRS